MKVIGALVICGMVALSIGLPMDDKLPPAKMDEQPPVKPEILPIEPKPVEPCKATCRKMCQFGFLLDGACPRCTCAPNPCDTAKCPKSNVCVTEPSDCGLDMCPHKASCKGTGLIMPEITPQVLPIDIKPGDCKLTCKKSCEFGYLDDGSCPRCTCAPSPCEKLNCRADTTCVIQKPMDCPGNDCPVLANCVPVDPIPKPNPMTPGKNGACETTVKKACPFGFRNRGCPRSRCALNPCLKKQCKKGRICVTKPKKCGFATGCPHIAKCEKEPIAIA